MSANSAVFYRGPSELTGEPIMAVLTGLRRESRNPKTGPMLQTYILRSDMPPNQAVATGADAAVCGTCPLRGDGRYGRTCYVTWWMAPVNVFKATRAVAAIAPAELARQVRGRFVRVGSYGDPAAVPFAVWDRALASIAGWTGYTHHWRTCDPRLRDLLMASVESEAGADEAQARGWRTFRARRPGDELRAHEVICPASHEAGKKLTCQQCGLCRGGASRSTRSIAIIAHGRFANHLPG